MPMKSHPLEMYTEEISKSHIRIEDIVFAILSKLQNSQNIVQKIIALFFFIIPLEPDYFNADLASTENWSLKVLLCKPLQ